MTRHRSPAPADLSSSLSFSFRGFRSSNRGHARRQQRSSQRRKAREAPGEHRVIRQPGWLDGDRLETRYSEQPRHRRRRIAPDVLGAPYPGARAEEPFGTGPEREILRLHHQETSKAQPIPTFSEDQLWMRYVLERMDQADHVVASLGSLARKVTAHSVEASVLGERDSSAREIDTRRVPPRLPCFSDEITWSTSDVEPAPSMDQSGDGLDQLAVGLFASTAVDPFDPRRIGIVAGVPELALRHSEIRRRPEHHPASAFHTPRNARSAFGGLPSTQGTIALPGVFPDRVCLPDGLCHARLEPDEALAPLSSRSFITVW